MLNVIDCIIIYHLFESGDMAHTQAITHTHTYNGLWARDLMPCLCRVFAVISAIFTKVCGVFLPFFAMIFYCPYTWHQANTN